MESSAPVLPRLPWPRSLVLTGVLGWLVPGLGQLYVGRPTKALLFLGAILPTFLLGWALTDFTVIDRDRYGLDFVAQVLLGGPTLAAEALARGRVLEALPRFFDVGRLYVQVAGLLNLVAVSDALGEAIAHNRRRDRLRAERAEALRAAGTAPAGPCEATPEDATPEDAALGEAAPEEARPDEAPPPSLATGETR